MLRGRHNSAFNRINLSRVSGGGGGGQRQMRTSAKCLIMLDQSIVKHLNF